MSLVWYPDQLQAMCELYDDACTKLEQRGVSFSRELLAKHILGVATDGTLGAAGDSTPMRVIQDVWSDPAVSRYLH